MYYDNKTTVTTYDGEKKQAITKEEFYKLYDDLFGENAYVYCSDESKLVSEYSNFKKNCEIIYKESKGLIDYEKAGYSHKKAVLKLLFNMSQGIEDPEPLTELEEQWIHKTFVGALIFSEPMTLYDAVCYDNNSAYGNAMKSTGFKIPIKAGNFSEFKELPDILPFGIYRCIIEKTGNYDNDKLFRFNDNNKYCHYDIYSARKLGLKITLIIDGQANTLQYGAGKCVNASTMFKTMIEYLYDLKLKKVQFAKSMLTNVWGGLCERNKINKVVKDSNETDFEVPSDCDIVSIRPRQDGDMIQYARRGKLFKLSYARLAPFITANIRKFMTDTIYPYRSHVYRCHTDSILSSKPIPELKLSTDIGNWKIEHQGKCVIENSMSVKWL
jgi:hypothetical protein